MAYTITDINDFEITLDTGVTVVTIWKQNIRFGTIDGDILPLFWHNRAQADKFFNENIDWNDVVAPVVISAADLQSQIEAMITSGWGGGSGVASVTDDSNGVVSVDNTDPVNPVIEFNGVNVDADTLDGNGESGTPLLVKTQMSITQDGSGLKLSGDATSPGNSQLYGTNGAGTKGWYAQPAALTDGDKGDITVSASGATWTIDNDAVTYAKIQDVTATARVLGRNSGGSGIIEEVTLSQLLDFVGSAAQGDILYRNNTGWVRLGAGTVGQYLKTGGAAANPSWADNIYTLSVQALISNPADNQQIYFGNLPKAPTTTSGISRVYIPRDGTVIRAEIWVYSATAGSNEAWPMVFRLNNTTDTSIASLSVNTSDRRYSNTGLSIAVTTSDYFEIRMDNPAWGTNPASTIIGGYIVIKTS